jgi:hypothetical protein
MRAVQHKYKLPMVNFDMYIGGGGEVKRRHSKLLPSNIRCVVCGPSNVGKTNAVFNLLFAEQGLKFENLYVFSKSLYQPKYKFLAEVMAKVPEIGFYTYSENEEVPPPNEAKSNSIMIFDDVACEKQYNIRDYFAMGRHNNIDSFYLCQTYSRIPKILVRDNSNFLLIFRQDYRNLKHIYNDHVNTDMSFEKFKSLCVSAWSQRHQFLVVDKESDMDKGRYRIGFDRYIESV